MENDETGMLSSYLYPAVHLGGLFLLFGVLRAIFGRKVDTIEQRCQEDFLPCGETKNDTSKHNHINPQRESRNLFTYHAPQYAQKASVHSSQARFYSSQEYGYQRTRSELDCQREYVEHANRNEECDFRDYYARSKIRTGQTECCNDCTTFGDVSRHDVKSGDCGDCGTDSYGDVRQVPLEKYYGHVRRELHSEVFTHRRQTDADKFDGSTNVDSYLRKFERIAKWNGWSYEEKGIQLRMCLRGKADSIVDRVLKGTDGEDYESLERVLVKCLTPVGAINMYRNEFKNRKKRKNEDIQEFGRSIQELAEKAYPEDYSTGLEGILIDKFIGGLDNAAMREHVLYGKPKTLDEAIELAQETELVQSYEEGLLNEQKGEERNKREEDENVTTSMEAVLRQMKKTMEIFEEKIKGHDKKTRGKGSSHEGKENLPKEAGCEASNSNKGRDFDRRSRGNGKREFVRYNRFPFKGRGGSRFKMGKEEAMSPKANQEREASLERGSLVGSVVRRNSASPEDEDVADSAQDSVIGTGDNSNSGERVVDDCTQVSGRGVVEEESVLVNRSKASWEMQDLTSSELVESPLGSCEKKGLLIERISKLDASGVEIAPEVGDDKQESQTQVKDVSVAQRPSDLLESRDVTDPVDDGLLSTEESTNSRERVVVGETCEAEQETVDREGTLVVQNKDLQETNETKASVTGQLDPTETRETQDCISLQRDTTEQGGSDQDDSHRCFLLVTETEKTTKTEERSSDVTDLKQGYEVKAETLGIVKRATKAIVELVWETGWVLPGKIRPPVRPPPWPPPGFWSHSERGATRLLITLV
ncbi:uncharacterized protein [Littorina saxatilis]|uniref:uncharacterized protein n=1 Tax=Littorina saxatilis TaxID=31220 RepID=UPI0038B544F5